MVGTRLPVHIQIVKFILFSPASHLGNFNVHLPKGTMRDNGNRSNFGPNLTKTFGNHGNTRVVSPSSDMVCGNPQQTEIEVNHSVQIIVSI